MLKNLIITSLCFITLLFSSCYEDSFIEDTLSPSFSPNKVYLNEIRGVVIDTTGMPLADVAISIEDKKAITDEKGRFVITETPIGESGAYIDANKSGYLEGGIRVYGSDQLSIQTTIVLIPIGSSYSFDNKEGTQIDDPSGISLKAAASNFLKNGNEYDGSITVNIYWVNHLKTDGLAYGLQVFDAATEDNQTPFDKINSLSTAYISVTDEQGNPLEVKPQQPIEVIFPTHSAQLDAIGSYDLLSFNRTLGLWVKEGTATYTGNGYSALLNHFSWWTVGNTENSTELCIDFNLLNGTASNDNIFTVSKTDGSIIYMGGVNYNADVCLLIPVDEALEIEIYSYCLVSIYNQGFEGSSIESDKIIINIDNEPTGYTITGDITNCLEETYTSSVELYYSTELSEQLHGIVQGSFSIDLDPCFNSEFFFITAIDEVTRQLAVVEIELMPGTTTYSVGLTFCNASSDADNQLTLGDQVFTDVIARQNPEETLIIAQGSSANPVFIGIDGFTEGTFPARLIDDRGQGCEGTVNISTYGDIGETVAGSYKMEPSGMCPGYEGSFIATRER